MSRASFPANGRTIVLRRVFANAMRFAARALVIGATTLGWQSTAAAQQVDAALRNACRADYQRFCGNVAVGGGRVRQCMMDHLDKLAPQCQAALKPRTQSK